MQQSSDIFYMAPMLGITDSSYRTAYMEKIGGFDTGISPFLRTLQGQRFKPGKVGDLAGKKNKSLEVTPQILTNQADDFIHLANVLFDMGHKIINLNMGCPVPTSAGRGRGAGMLPEFEFVDRLLDSVLNKIPNLLSVKTRIGFENEDDLLKMTAVFNRYPLVEIIIHPRTAKQKYQGKINHDRFSQACDELKHEVVYSGDIFNQADFEMLKTLHPGIRKWMLGRGMLQDPLLVHKLRQSGSLNVNTVRNFYSKLFELYSKSNLSPAISLARIKTLTTYLGVGQNFTPQMIRKLRKSRSFEDLMQHLPAYLPSTLESISLQN